MDIAFVADYAHDDIGFCCAGNGDFIAVFILLMIFAFSDTINSWLVQIIDFGNYSATPYQKYGVLRLGRRNKGIARKGISNRVKNIDRILASCRDIAADGSKLFCAFLCSEAT